MQKLIFLKQEYLDADEEKLSKKEAADLRQKHFLQTVIKFESQIKGIFFKVLKELPPEALFIEYNDTDDEKIWECFHASDIVDIVDSIIPQNIDEITNSDDICGYYNCAGMHHTEDIDVENLKNKMSKYMK